MSSVSVPDLHVDRTGTGPTLVCSHGVGSDTEVWSGWLTTLEPSYRVVRWDQPGHGRSPAVADDAYGAALAYASLRAVVDAERAANNGAPVILLGHSLGGYLSCRLAIDAPDQVAALVLVATGPGFRAPEAMAKWNADVTRQATKANRPAMLVGMHEDTLVMDHLADIACPTLVLVGSQDHAFLGATDYLERKVHGIERHTIDDAGHNIPATHGRALAGITAEFLARRVPTA